MRNLLRDPVVLVTVAVVVVGVVIALVWAARSSEGTDTDPASEQAVTLDDVTELREVVGRTVVAEQADVLDVPADEGLWIATAGEPAWVELSTAGESLVRVEDGDRVRFTGEVVAHDADFADRANLSTSDAADLAAAGAHIEVDPEDLVVLN